MVSQIYTAAPNDVITAARWNNEFGNIYNNGTTIAFPLTTAVSFNGQTVSLDAAGVTTLSSTAAVALSFTPGVKAGTPGSGANSGNIFNIAASTFTDTNTAGSGIAAEFSAVSIQRPTLAASNTLVTTTAAATLYINNSPAAGTNQTITNPYAIWVDNGVVRFDAGLAGTLALGGWINGLTYANNAGDATNDLDISVGSATDNGATPSARSLMILTALTKQSDANWAVGTNAGMLDTGAVGNSDYYLWIIQRPDTGVVDVLSSLSSTAPTMPTSYVFKRLFGWFKRTGGTIVAFTTYELSGGGIELLWTTPTLDVDLAATLTTARRTDALKVPLGFTTVAHVNVQSKDVADPSIYVYCPDAADQAPSNAAAPLATSLFNGLTTLEFNMRIRTSAAGLIAARGLTATVDNYRVSTLGFQWARRN